MSIQYYPFIHTATLGLDYNTWVYPEKMDKSLQTLCKLCMANDLYSSMTQPRHLFVRTAEGMVWGVCMENGMEFQSCVEDRWQRAIRGFYGGYIDFAEGVPEITELPLDFESGMPFTHMLFDKFIRPHWEARSTEYVNQIAEKMSYENLSIATSPVGESVETSVEPCEQGFYRMVPQEDGQTLESWFRALAASGQELGVLTSVNSRNQAASLAMKFGVRNFGLLGIFEEEKEPIRMPEIPRAKENSEDSEDLEDAEDSKAPEDSKVPVFPKNPNPEPRQSRKTPPYRVVPKPRIVVPPTTLEEFDSKSKRSGLETYASNEERESEKCRKCIFRRFVEWICSSRWTYLFGWFRCECSEHTPSDIHLREPYTPTYDDIFSDMKKKNQDQNHSTQE